MGKNNSASFGDCPTDEGGGGGGGSSNSKRPLSSSLTAERKRRQRQKSNELRKTLADCLEQVHQEHGGLTEVQNALEAKQPMRHQDLLEATISAIKWPKYQDFITRPHRPQVEKSPAPAHLQSDFDWMHKIAMLRSSMLGAIMVTTEDLVVKESSSAVKQFAPWDILDGYLGQSLWAMTCCRDFPVLEHMFTELLPVEREGLTGRKMRIRLKRIGKDVHSDNLLSKFVWQSVTVSWFPRDQYWANSVSCMLIHHCRGHLLVAG